jgi:MFS family permease
MPKTPSLALTPTERRASLALAGLFAARMLGLFLLLPVFAVAAQSLAGGDDPARVGLALGMYGLTQAFMQIPFGLASDRWGRRPVVLFGLVLFVLGSVVCALSTDIYWVTLGRAIQGSGAISAAVTAWLADVTRPEVRTRAMAMVGGSIGLSFALALVLAPLIVGSAGLAGLFWTIALLGVVCLAAKPMQVLTHTDLLRLNFGVFCLHLIQVALFVAVPPLFLKLGGLTAAELWKVYLPVIFGSFIFMVPAIFVAEKRHAHRAMLRLAVAGLVLACAFLAWASQSFYLLAFGLTAFFVMFNVLEALQPSLVSRVAPPELKGLALGFYNTTQAAGLFLGGALGGSLIVWGGTTAVFWSASALAAVWLVVTWGLKPFAPRS